MIRALKPLLAAATHPVYGVGSGRHGIQANEDVGSFGVVNAALLPDGRPVVVLTIAADEEHRYTLHPGDTFPVRDQTWKLDRVDDPAGRNWTVVLSRVE